MKKVLILLLWLLPSCSVVIFAQTQRIAGTVPTRKNGDQRESDG